MANSDLAEFIRESKQIVQKFQETLHWYPATKQQDKFAQCPFNERHKVPQHKIDEHGRLCKWRSHGYTAKESREINEEESTQFPYPCIKIDDIVSKVAPGLPPLRTYEAYMSILSREERLEVYDEILKRVKSKKCSTNSSVLADLQTKGFEISKPSTGDELPESQLAKLKEQRDHKRRRQTYRAKNVHITKRTQTEIFRDVLQVHMEELRQFWNNDSQGKASTSVSDQASEVFTNFDEKFGSRSHAAMKGQSSSFSKESYRDRNHERSRSQKSSDRNLSSPGRRRSLHPEDPEGSRQEFYHKREKNEYRRSQEYSGDRKRSRKSNRDEKDDPEKKSKKSKRSKHDDSRKHSKKHIRKKAVSP